MTHQSQERRARGRRGDADSVFVTLLQIDIRLTTEERNLAAAARRDLDAGHELSDQQRANLMGIARRVGISSTPP